MTTNAAKFIKTIVYTVTTPGIRKSKQSKEGRAIIAAEMQLDENQHSASKKLLDQNSIIAELTNLRGQIGKEMAERAAFRGNGQYWILPAKMLATNDLLTNWTKAYNQLLEDLANALPGILASEQIAKGAAFELSDYETADQIRAKKMSWQYDFQADVSAIASLFDCEDMAAAVAEDYEAQQEAKYSGIRAQLVSRILDATTRIFPANSTGTIPKKSAAQKIGLYDHTRKGAILHSAGIVSQVKEASELVGLLLTDDYDVKTSCQKLARLAARTSTPESLKDPLFASQWLKDIREAVETIQTDTSLQLTPVVIVPANDREQKDAPVVETNNSQAQPIQPTAPAVATTVPGFSLS